MDPLLLFLFKLTLLYKPLETLTSKSSYYPFFYLTSSFIRSSIERPYSELTSNNCGRWLKDSDLNRESSGRSSGRREYTKVIGIPIRETVE